MLCVGKVMNIKELIGLVLNKQGTGYDYLKLMVHFPNLPKLERFVWTGGTPVPPVHTKLSYFSDFEKCTMHLCFNQ